MYRRSAYYPQGGRFDFDYYRRKHLPMVADRMGSAIVRWEADSGVAGGEPGSSPPNVAVGHLYFNSLDDFKAAFNAHSEEILGDLPNFTDMKPLVQISEIVSG